MTHPLVRTGRNYVIGGVVFGLAGAGLATLTAGLSGIAPTLFALAGGAFFVWNGRSLITSGIAVPLLQESLALVTKGKLDEAERAPDRLPKGVAQRPMVARAVTMQRALIALMRGDAVMAESSATESIAIPAGFFTTDWDEVQRNEARATRAIARAAQGKSTEALEDVASIEASPQALSGHLGRAALARAVVLARSGDRAALGVHLAAHGSLILEHVMPRERSLTRALRAMARAPAKSAYREAARPDESNEAGRVRSWIEQVAPDAAGFAPNEVYVEAPQAPAPQADPVAMKTIAAARAAASPKKNKSAGRVLVLWGVLIGMFLVIWQFLSPADATPAPIPDVEDAPPTAFALLAPCVLATAFVVAFVVWWMRRYRKKQGRLFKAERDLAFGRTEAAQTELRSLTTDPYPALAATSRMLLAYQANKDARFAEAIVESDLGLGHCNRGPTAKALTSDIVAPGLIAERALALAALDRFAEAETELAHLTNGFPTYSLLARALFRVRLVSAVRRRDLVAAAAIALSRTPEMPLDLKIDLLADAALAASGEPMSAGERERIATELRAMPEVNAWVSQIAGDLSRVRVEALAAEERDDADEGDDAVRLAQA